MNRLIRFEMAFAFAAIALGVFLLVGSSGINLGSGYDRIGPRFFPYLIAGGLLFSAGFMILEGLRSKNAASKLHFEVIPLITIIAGLILSVLLLERLGFIFSVTLLFTLVARGFKSRRIIRDALVGLLLSIMVYVIFTSGLGLVLPRGILSGII